MQGEKGNDDHKDTSAKLLACTRGTRGHSTCATSNTYRHLRATARARCGGGHSMDRIVRWFGVRQGFRSGDGGLGVVGAVHIVGTIGRIGRIGTAALSLRHGRIEHASYFPNTTVQFLGYLWCVWSITKPRVRDDAHGHVRRRRRPLPCQHFRRSVLVREAVRHAAEASVRKMRGLPWSSRSTLPGFRSP